MLVSKIKEIKNGRVITKDAKTKDSFYDVFAKRDGRRQKFNNKPLILEEANELVEHINKAGMPSVEKGSAERVIIMNSKTKDVVLVNGYEIKPSPESRTWVVMKDGDVIKRFNDYESAYRFAKGNSKDAIDPTKPKNIAAAKNLSKAQGQAASDGGPGSGQKGHKSAHIPDPSTHKERRKERANLQKYIENARRSGNIKEAQKHSQRLAHINSLSLNS